MIFKNPKVYDVLKWIALVGCYALNYLWVELAEVWGFPYAVQIGKTISIVGVFIGILIGVSGVKYNERRMAKSEAVAFIENERRQYLNKE